jgi:hypothetical protein
MLLGGTHCGDSTGSRDCSHRPAGLSDSVSDHCDRGLCVKERMKDQLQWQLAGGEIVVVIMVKSSLEREERIAETSRGERGKTKAWQPISLVIGSISLTKHQLSSEK